MGVPKNGLQFMALDKILVSMFIASDFVTWTARDRSSDLKKSQKIFIAQIFGLFICLFVNFNLHIQLLLEISHWKYQTKTKTKTKTAILKL